MKPTLVEMRIKAAGIPLIAVNGIDPLELEFGNASASQRQQAMDIAASVKAMPDSDVRSEVRRRSLEVGIDGTPPTIRALFTALLTPPPKMDWPSLAAAAKAIIRRGDV